MKKINGFKEIEENDMGYAVNLLAELHELLDSYYIEGSSIFNYSDFFEISKEIFWAGLKLTVVVRENRAKC